MAEDALRALLRSSEHLKAILETQYIQPSTWESTEDDEQSTRILAVVAHRDGWRVLEEEVHGLARSVLSLGQSSMLELRLIINIPLQSLTLVLSASVFVCRFKPMENDSAPDIEIEHVFPVTGDFSIAMAQARRKPIVLGAPPVADQHTGFTLTVNPGKSLDADFEYKQMTFFTNDIKGLRNLLRECKELQRIYDGSEDLTAFQSEASFRWLLPYTPKHELIQIFGPIPQDLRLVNQPLHARLSPAAAGLPGDDVADIQLIRDEWMRAQAHATSHKGRRKLRIRLGTFNVNGNLPSQDLSGWLNGQAAASYTSFGNTIPPSKGVPPSLSEATVYPLDTRHNPIPAAAIDEGTTLTSTVASASTVNTTREEYKFVDPDPGLDMIVLGFQELDLSTEALIYSSGTAREDAWCVAVFAALGEKGALYTKLSSKQLVGMLLVVLVKKTLVPCFTEVCTSAAGAGIMGVMGNKGGTAARVTFTPPANTELASLGSTTFTFVNAHLAAFDEMFERRNSDFHDLSKRLTFESEITDTSGLTPLPIAAYESDVLFWMGDLNYRIDLPESDVRGVLGSDKWEGRFETLLRYDQLRKAIRSGRAFVGFNEHPILHLPTYRFSHGMVTDELGYDIKRKPAWTDRILYMSAPSIGLQQLSYTSHPQITMSDHRPVAADFVVEIDLYDKDLQADTARKFYRTVGQIENLADRAVIQLDSTSVDMGQISYGHASSQTIRLQNIGKRPCAYRFVPVDPNSHIHPEWLRIEPMQALILPGEYAHITLTAYVDNQNASKLNLGPKDLTATLILHTVMGKDHFLTVSGEYLYTCFANSLSRLTRLQGPVRSLSSPDELRPKDHPINAPRELMRLVNWLMSDHANVDGLFISPADESVVNTIRECLDTGNDFPFSADDVDPHVAMAFAATLVNLLDSLVDPVVPASLHPRCVQVTSRDEAFELLDAFPPASVNVWISLTAFLHFICQSSSAHQPSANAERIATLFAPILLRDDLQSPLPAVSPLGKRDFILYFIN